MSDAVIMGIVTAVTTIALALISAMRHPIDEKGHAKQVKVKASTTPGRPSGLTTETELR